MDKRLTFIQKQARGAKEFQIPVKPDLGFYKGGIWTPSEFLPIPGVKSVLDTDVKLMNHMVPFNFIWPFLILTGRDLPDDSSWGYGSFAPGQEESDEEKKTMPVSSFSMLSHLFFVNYLNIVNGKNPPYLIKKMKDDSYWGWLNPSIRDNQGTFMVPTVPDWKAATANFPLNMDKEEFAKYVWFSENSGGCPHPVAELLPWNMNEGLAGQDGKTGIFDLVGNLCATVVETDMPFITNALLKEHFPEIKQAANNLTWQDVFDAQLLGKARPVGTVNWLGLGADFIF